MLHKLFLWLFDTGSLTAHGFCLLWRPDLIWPQVIADLLTAAAYFSIPIAMLYFVAKRRELSFPWLFALFGSFILCCGLTHVMGVATLWHPAYGLETLFKVLTAIISVITAVTLWPLMPKVLAMPSAAQLGRLNQVLASEVLARRQIEAQLRDLNLDLERAVADRTTALTRSNVELQRARTAAELASRINSQLVESLPVGLVLVDSKGQIVMTNPALNALFDYQPGDLAGKPIEALLPQRIRGGHVGLRAAFIADPEMRAMGSGRDLMAQQRDGREFPVEIGLTPIDTEDGRQVLAAVTDISLRKKFEATLKQANAQLEEFTYVVSHDLRSPVRGIGDLLGWIRDDLDEEQLTDSVRNNFERAQLRVARAERMIDDLLEFARVGQTLDRVELVDPAKLVEESLGLLRVPEGFTVEVDVASAPFKTARTPLSLALRNLIGNAFKHHGGQCGLVRITLHEAGRFNVFTVEDDGIGVPKGGEERIFKLFHRANQSTPGDGVGLAVTRRMVNSAGGMVVLDRAGTLGGACFRLHWPRFQLKEIA